MDVRDKMAYGRYRKAYADLTEQDQQTIRGALARPIKSADRQELSQGTRVFTNNLDRGTVDFSRLDYGWHAGEQRWVPWFDVITDTDYKGQPTTGRVLQSDDRVAVRFNGKTA